MNIKNTITQNKHNKLKIVPDLDPDLRWPWKSYRCECLIDSNKYHYLVCGCIKFDCGCTDVWTYVRTDGHFYRVY